MKTTRIFAGALMLAAGFVSLGSAQTYVPTVPQYTPGGFGYIGGYHHASTYEEGVLRGLADLQRSGSESNYWHSLAENHWQDAYSKYLQNREAKTETYFRLQSINRAAREATRPQRLTTEQYAVLAKKQAPDRLGNHQYDRTLGRLNWPAVLNNDLFTAEREVLDAAFAARTPGDAGVSSSFSSGVRQLTKNMQDKLQANVHSLNQMEYLAAKKFLAGVAIEAQQPVVPTGLASAE